MNQCLTTCRTCCKFTENEIYFAPKITIEEINNLKSNNLYKKVFLPFKNSQTVFQISLVKSEFSKDIFICPYLNKDTQVCEIYKIKPFDCEFWPFLVMYDQKKEKVFIAHFDQNTCQITNSMNKTQFKNYLNKQLNKWIEEKNIIKLINKYPDLIWDYEKNTFILKEIDLIKK